MKTLTCILLLCTLGAVSCKEKPVLTTGGITGIVYNRQTGEPLGGVLLTLSPPGLSQTSRSDGRFEFERIEPGQYDIEAQASGYKYNVRFANVLPGQHASCDIPLEPLNK